MTSQLRNDELVKLLAPDFFGKNEPNSSWVHYQGAIMSTCALKGFWPMSVIHFQTPNVYAVDIATGHGLTFTNTPTAGYLATATQTALPPWINFVAISTQMLTYGADDSEHDITGLETHVSANERGLTCGGWFKFTSVPLSNFGLITKWYRTAAPINQAAYRLIKNANNNIIFSVSPDGTAAAAITAVSSVTVVADTWYHCYGRFIPGVSVDVFVDNIKDSTVAGVPASVFNCNEPFIIGRYNRTDYLDGKASMCHLNASQLSDSIIEVLWEQSRVMYGKEG